MCAVRASGLHTGNDQNGLYPQSASGFDGSRKRVPKEFPNRQMRKDQATVPAFHRNFRSWKECHFRRCYVGFFLLSLSSSVLVLSNWNITCS